MVAIALVSIAIELTAVTRRAVENARREADYTALTLVLQIDRAVGARRDMDPLAVVGSDPQLRAALDAATQYAPSVLYVAFTDPGSRAILHSDPEEQGRVVEAHRALPTLGGPASTWRFLGDLFGGREIYETLTPVRLGEVRLGAVRITHSTTFLRSEVMGVLRRGAFLALSYIAVALVAAVFLTRIVLGPLGEVRRGIEALRAGDFSYRIPHQNIQEFGFLAQALNELGAQFHERELTRGDGENLRRAVELLGDGLLVVGPDREITLINGIAAHFLGVDAGAVQGRSLVDVLPADHSLVGLADDLLGGHHERVSIRAELSAAGVDRAVMAIGHRVHDGSATLGALIELKDLAVLRDLQAVMDHSTVLSRLGEMAAGVAHEIRNPLNAIILHLEPLRSAQRLDPEEVRAAVETTRQQIARLDRAVSGFLKVARLRQLKIERVDPSQLAREVAALLGPEATMNGMEIAVVEPEEIPPLAGDAEVLRQALINLVKNAIQATPSREGRITIGLRAERERIVFSVKDSGPGMTEELRRKAFDLYMTTKEHGTGVGLPFVLQAVEMHGGSVSLQSAPGEGTTVTLVLRAAVAEEGNRADGAALAGVRGATRA
jgi:signal transduction histidine kinase/HAMP domain-containing protein